jgi:hypothetical protein
LKRLVGSVEEMLVVAGAEIVAVEMRVVVMERTAVVLETRVVVLERTVVVPGTRIAEAEMRDFESETTVEVVGPERRQPVVAAETPLVLDLRVALGDMNG